METKTINYLNSKVWYRTLKVFYIVLFVIIFIGYNFASWLAIKNVTPDYASIAKKYGGIQIKPIPISREKYIAKFGETLEQTQTRATQGQVITSVIMHFILGNLVILLFFEMLRRAFYYIVLGTLRPQK